MVSTLSFSDVANMREAVDAATMALPALLLMVPSVLVSACAVVMYCGPFRAYPCVKETIPPV